ncbi:MAG: monovalent cation/H(+) antiporter subunit G [Betaproteobacteria bacterium]|jgi:multicomponent Na+:H+ antiporter subunit G|nr:monovalent cation/H(+) antiporter subunit G [Betaproteobacteria bacterium]
MNSLTVDILSWSCLLAGGFFCVVGALGLLRMPDFYTRMHAASVIDTLGAGLILLGLILQAGFTLVAAKLVMIGLLLFFTGPVVAHALAKAAMSRGLAPLLAESGPNPAPATSPASLPSGEHEQGGR